MLGSPGYQHHQVERKCVWSASNEFSASVRITSTLIALLLFACQPSPSFSGSGALTPSSLSRSAGPLRLSAQPASAVLNGPALASPLAAGLRRYLVLRGLTASVQPGVLYSVYIDLPPGARPAANDPRHIGSINFFAARPPDAAKGPDAAAPHNQAAEKLFFSFDLTDTVDVLKQRGQLLPRTTVTFIADGPPDQSARVVVGRLEIVDQ